MSPKTYKYGIWSRIIQTLSKYSNLIIAGATIALVTVTVLHMCEASRMRSETKRLVDLSVKEFMIRSYPTFLVTFELKHLDSEKISQQYKINNKGETTAFNVTSLVVNIYEHEAGGQKYYPLPESYYKRWDKTMTSFDFEMKLLPDSEVAIVNNSKIPPNESVERLKSALLFIRFKVPYDQKYRYETYGYLLKRVREKPTDESKPFWQPLASKDTQFLDLGYVSFIKESKREEDKALRNFFVDHPAKRVGRRLIRGEQEPVL